MSRTIVIHRRLAPRQMPLQRLQRGVVLFVALIVLVALTLAGVGLMRSVGSGVLIAGNLALKQSTTSAADMGIEVGRNWLTNTDLSVLNNNGTGYFSSWDNEFDPVHPETPTWWRDNGVAVPVAGTAFDAYDIRYVVHRLCKEPGLSPNDSAQSCVVTGAAQGQNDTGAKTNAGVYGQPSKQDKYVYYRVTVRVLGPKNTVSYAQTIMY